MPIYQYRCTACGADQEFLQRLGEAAPAGGCPDCGGALRKRFSRVAVKYGSWGFTSTDQLSRSPGSKDFKALRERAERISDGE
ncbi:MAG: FmdB family zinc ribbon protein [Candidatus Rokuibacteriota bacterium]